MSVALEAFQTALQCDPRSVPALNNAGNVLRELGEYAPAVAAYSEAIRLDSARPESHLNLGISLQEMGRLDESLVALREAVRLRPDYGAAWTSLANALAESH